MFDNEFIENLPEENLIALQEIKDHFIMGIEDLENQNDILYYSDLVQAYSFLIAFLEKIECPMDLAELSTEDRRLNIKNIHKAFDETLPEYIESLENIVNKNLFSESKNRFSAKLGTGFAYEFSEGDLKKVQISIDELRKLISQSKDIKKNHKQRLLKRLERLQGEIHKKMSDLDRFWGFVGDAGVVMGKFGKDAKPFTDRIKDIMNIIWRTQARAEELESGSPNPFLKESNEDDN